MSILESIQQAEQQAADNKRTAIGNAREILRQAEQDASVASASLLSAARDKAAVDLAQATQEAETEAGIYMTQVDAKSVAVIEKAKAKLPQAADAIVQKLLG